MVVSKRIKYGIPLLLAGKDFIAYQLTIPWEQLTSDPYAVLYKSLLIFTQAVVTNIIVFNHLVSREAKKVNNDVN